jgi:hypothetical protein
LSYSHTWFLPPWFSHSVCMHTQKCWIFDLENPYLAPWIKLCGTPGHSSIKPTTLAKLGWMESLGM